MTTETVMSGVLNTSAYLKRIGFGGVDAAPSLATLKSLQRWHLLAVPFENLDIHWKRPIVLDIGEFFKKIVVENRGGFCYELNGLFDQLLRDLNFRTRLVSGRVFNGSEHGPEFDHAAILVTIRDEEYLADVGFGDFSTEPLQFTAGIEQADQSGTFIIREFGQGYFEVAKKSGGEWKSEYIFKDVERRLADFAPMCNFQQYSPDSHFTKGKICSILTETGRKTLTDKKFIVTAGGAENETEVASEAEFESLLEKEFAISPVIRERK